MPDPEIQEQSTVVPGSQTTVRDLGRLLVKYGQRHLPSPPPRRDPAQDQPPRLTGTFALALAYLRLIPAVLVVLFAISFAWDFTGWEATFLGHTFNFEGLLRITTVSGLIGFLTNWLAITMLFQPRRRRPILGQGLIPSQRDRVIYRLAQGVSKELINADIIKQKIQESGAIRKYRAMGVQVVHGILGDIEFRAELKKMVVDYAQQVLQTPEVRARIAQLVMEKLEHYAGKGLEGLALKAYRMFKEENLQKRIDIVIRDLPTTLDDALDEADEMFDSLPEKIEDHADEIEDWITKMVLGFVERLDIYEMIRSNMAQFDESRLEMLLKNTTNEQLNYIKYLGGVLGFFGGLIIWEPVFALGLFGSLGLILYGLDVMLFRVRQKEIPAPEQDYRLNSASQLPKENQSGSHVRHPH